ITLNPNAPEEADRLDAAYRASGPVGPLHGIPVLVKDQADARGMPTTLGAVPLKDYYPDRDCFVVEQLRKAGAIILGKTTLGELATMLEVMVGYDADDPVTAMGMTHHPTGLAASLEPGALRGARIGVLRQAMGRDTEPGTEDFNKVAAVFDRVPGELQKAGAT